MRILVELPASVAYHGTTEWVLDEEGDGQWWAISDLRDDVRAAVGDSTLTATKDGVDLDVDAVAIEVLAEGDTVVFTTG